MQGLFNMSTNTNQQRAILRKQLRQQRRSLDIPTQLEHALSITRQLSSCALYRRSKRIAAYLAEDGEIDAEFLIYHAWRSNKKVYLPVLSPFAGRLYFAPFRQGCKMKLNRFNIAEPDIHPRHWLKPNQLGLILMPLVGFDAEGNRLGMGGGFYDRSLEFTRYHKANHRPALIGLAHQVQQVKKLPHQPHDIPMQMIVTEQQIIRC